MTEEQKQEQISRFFVGSIVAHAGHVFQMNDIGGVDAVIRQMTSYQREKGKRILTSGNVIDIQLKCTTERGITRRKNGDGSSVLIFDLEEKNYNDLIIRKKLRESSLASSLLLILVVLPEDKSQWFSISQDGDQLVKSILLGGSAYWYYPEGDLAITQNHRKKRIVIPAENALNLNFMESLRLQKIIT